MVMTSQAYRDWVANGSPWKYARPVLAVGDRLAAHGYTVYFEGNLEHLTKDTPEDHCPFSATGWPGKSPYPYCMALDIMPPKDGQVSRLTGRRLPTLQQLGARLRADRIAGHPGAAWLKYMNWEPSGDNTGSCWHETWQPTYARTTSGDRGHIHGSCRTDAYLSDAADGYDLVLRAEEDMTTWGWDLSHYDAPDSRKAVAEGFSFFTHKAGGDANDAELVQWWTYMKPYRPGVLLGAYWVQYPGNPAGRADAFIARLDSQCPGWREGPFILQVDCEIWGGDTSTKPGLADIRAFCNRLRVLAPKLMPIVYAPKWAYQNTLTGLGFPLWASAYVSGSGSASALYPGDNAAGWNVYSGQTPAVLQFSSSATIAGQTTCDANAFRGSPAQLQALLAPGWATEGIDDMAFTEAQMRAFPWQYVGGGIPVGMSALAVFNEILLNSRAQKLRDEALLAAVQDDADRDEILARIDARAAELETAVSNVDEEVWSKVPNPEISPEEKARLLAAVLGADAQAVGQILASIPRAGYTPRTVTPVEAPAESEPADDIFTQTQREIAQRRIQGGDQG